VVSVFFLVTGGNPAPASAPATPAAVALAELTDGRIRQFTPMQVQERLDRYLDRAERTDAQLRNAHRIWARRINDPDYSDPDLAADMFAIIDTALRLRGVRPHSDI
jgi:hypothetical protein